MPNSPSSSPSDIPRHREREFAILFTVMLAIAAGNTALQSIMPVLTRTLGLSDMAIAVAFSFSALLWSVAAPWWARQIHRRGSRQMIMTGLAGYVLSQLLCGIALSLSITGYLAPALGFGGFMVSRIFYGALGAAAPPAAQAMIAVHTTRDERTNALAMLASAFGLGTIVGPALAPFFVLPVVGTAGAPFVFALAGVVVMAAVMAALPGLPSAGAMAQGASSSYPSIGGQPTGASVVAAMAEPSGTRLRWRDARIFPWLMTGIIGGHAQAMTAMTIGFLILDRLHLPINEAQQVIGIVLMTGAGAALLTQWALIPRLGLSPRAMILWGSAIAAIGLILTAYAATLHALAVTFAIASLGFGFLRPGFSAGASLATASHEQGDVAGKVTAVNGSVFVLGPSVGMLLYGWDRILPFEFAALSLVALIAFTVRRVHASPPSA